MSTPAEKLQLEIAKYALLRRIAEEEESMSNKICGAFDLLQCVAPPHESGPHSYRIPPYPHLVLPWDLAQRVLEMLWRMAPESARRQVALELSEWIPPQAQPPLRLVKPDESAP